MPKKAGRVITFETDKRFEPLLSKLPDNVEVHYENAKNFFQLRGKFKKKRVYNKVVSNMSYSLNELFLHNLTFLDYDKVVLLVPKKFRYSAQTNPIFSSFFKIEQKLEVSKNLFYPSPKTNSVIIDLKKLPDPIKNKNLPLFLKQYIYQHEKQKSKNALMEGLIKYHQAVNRKKLTKNKARGIINGVAIDKRLLENPPNSFDIYKQVGRKF